MALVSVRSSCAQELADPEDREGVKDYGRDLDGRPQSRELELRYEPQWLECQSPDHEGDRAFQTTYRPRRGEPVYCDACRQAYAQRRANGNFAEEGEEDYDYGPQAGMPVIGETLTGVVEFKKEEKGLRLCHHRRRGELFLPSVRPGGPGLRGAHRGPARGL